MFLGFLLHHLLAAVTAIPEMIHYEHTAVRPPTFARFPTNRVLAQLRYKVKEKETAFYFHNLMVMV